VVQTLALAATGQGGDGGHQGNCAGTSRTTPSLGIQLKPHCLADAELLHNPVRHEPSDEYVQAAACGIAQVAKPRINV
jgi:hypothetical protein